MKSSPALTHVRHMGFDLERKHAILVRVLQPLNSEEVRAILECVKPINLRRAVMETLGVGPWPK